MKRLCAMFVLAGALAGCPQSDNYNGPGGSRLEPAAAGSTQFGTDDLVVAIEAHALDEKYEPQITGTEFIVDNLPSALASKVERWHGTAGYGQRVKFTVPLGANSVKAIVYVQHLGRIYQVTVPFNRDSRNLQSVKWIRHDPSVQMVGAVPAPPK